MTPVTIDSTGCTMLLLIFHCINYNSFVVVLLFENCAIWTMQLFLFRTLSTRQVSGLEYETYTYLEPSIYIQKEMTRFTMCMCVLTAHKYLI